MPGDAPTFAPLVERALAHDEAAWHELVDRLSGVVWKAVRSFDLREEDRKDAFAATFFRLHDRLGSVREPEKLPGWIATTARNEVHTLLRARRRLEPVADVPTGPDRRGPDEGLLDDELLAALRIAFASLSMERQELLRLLMAVPAVSYDEIERRLGKPHGWIGPTRKRCLESLREHPALRPFLDAPPDRGVR